MRFLVGLLLFVICGKGVSQSPDTASVTEQRIVLSNKKIQIEATQAINDLYNFRFESAEQQFRWIRQKYAWHPLPHFLLGLSQWWKIMPNIDNTEFDKVFLAYMDTTILIAENLHQTDEFRVESAFFMAAAHGFKARLYSERSMWRKAASAGANALKYLDTSRGQHDLSVELLFGDALYNYFSVWIPDNYPLLKPILVFFPSGDKELGLRQLRTVANNAFYTRTEAQVFLMRILGLEENEKLAAFQIAQYLRETFPDNAYFHRFYAMMLYQLGRTTELMKESLDIIAKIDSGRTGYEQTSGRYASFYLGQYYQKARKIEKARHYYERTVRFAEAINAFESGYYLYSLLRLTRIHMSNEEYQEALAKIDKIRDNSKRRHPTNKQAREYRKEIKRKQRKAN